MPAPAGLLKAHEHVPPVGDRHDQGGHHGGRAEVMGGEASPSPLVLHLVEDVLAVAAQRAYLFWRSPFDFRVSSDIFLSAVHAVLCLHFGRSHQDSMDFPVVQPPFHQTGEMRGLNKQFELNALQNT